MGSITIERPEIWESDQGVWCFLSDVLGAFTKWAVKQSPYDYPDNLCQGIDEFTEEAKRKITFDKAGMVQLPGNMIRKTVMAIIECCPAVVAWNTKKSGLPGHVFVNRYSGSNPDDDFIDLDALARNIAHDLILDGHLV